MSSQNNQINNIQIPLNNPLSRKKKNKLLYKERQKEKIGCGDEKNACSVLCFSLRARAFAARGGG